MTYDDFAKLCLDHSTDLICLHEINGLYIYLSPSTKNITGYTPDELIGKNPYDYFFDEEKEYIQVSGHRPSARGTQSSITDYRFRKKDDGFIWLKTQNVPIKNNAGEVVNILSISQDISEIKNKLDHLYKQEALWDEAGRLAQLGTWEVDLINMTPIWSKATYDIHEVPYTEKPNLSEAINFYPPEVRPIVESMVNDAVNLGKPWDKKLPFITAKGKKIWVRSIARPEIHLGKTVKLYGVFQNITKEIETREHQKELIEELSNQKKQLQEFNQIVSHNLRSPISSLNTLVSFFENEENEEEKKEILSNIKQVSLSLNSLLEELVDAVKIISNNTIEYETIDIKTAVKNSKTLLEGSLKAVNGTIEIDTAAWQTILYPKIYFDSILLNLLSNAIKYYSTERTLKIKITTTILNDKKALTISDNGLGINLERYGDKVFKLHKTFHRERPGKGLGLFMTKNQVEATGSQITIESEQGKGTTFTILFKDYKP